jgi:HAD superfamily hydrolase (TIGR01549 family)
MKFDNINAVIFDLEGTLLTSKINFLNMQTKMIKILTLYGFTKDSFPWLLITNSSKFKEALKEKGISKKKISKINKKITNAIEEVEMENIDETIEIEGAKETLQKLKTKNIKIGIVTRNCRKSTIAALKITDMLKFIDIIVARDDCENPKPDTEHLLKALSGLNIKPNEAIMVGDSWLDALCAINAKVKFIGVLTGYSSQEKFTEMGVDIQPSVKNLNLLGS